MGAAATERALAWVLGDQNPAGQSTHVISAGFCGALVEQLAVGDVIQPDEVIDTEGGHWALGHSRQVPTRLLSVSVPILTVEDRLALHHRFAAVAVDMESASAARCCERAGVPFASVRAVSDGLDSAVSADLSSALAGEHINLPRLALAVLRRPSLVGELRRLARQTRAAARALAPAIVRQLSHMNE
jgi:nucleoside phosphorylase